MAYLFVYNQMCIQFRMNEIFFSIFPHGIRALGSQNSHSFVRCQPGFLLNQLVFFNQVFGSLSLIQSEFLVLYSYNPKEKEKRSTMSKKTEPTNIPAVQLIEALPNHSNGELQNIHATYQLNG